MPTQLVFKGDKKPSKKRKRAEIADAGAQDPATRSLAASDAKTSSSAAAAAAVAAGIEDDDSWVTADAPSDISGPVLLVLPTSPPTCLACDATGTVFASGLENVVDGDAGTAEPHDVRQVWVASRVAGTERFGFKAQHAGGRYLGCDRAGVLSAGREAAGPEEGFAVVPASDVPGGFGLQTVRDRFVKAEEHEQDGRKDGAVKVTLRADAEFVEYSTTLRVRMQARFKPRLKANKEEKARERISRKELEALVGRRLEDDEVRMLKRARREGDFHERLLDVKVKGKHDKFA